VGWVSIPPEKLAAQHKRRLGELYTSEASFEIAGIELAPSLYGQFQEPKCDIKHVWQEITYQAH